MSKKTLKQDVNLVALIERYGNENKCRDYLEELRWPDDVTCPRCASTDISEIAARGQYHCLSCQYHFSVMSGTIFHDSHLPLWKWFLAAYMMIESKKGISANQMKRTLNVSYKTAWYLCHRIRAAMTEINPKPLTEIVEADETWVGGVKKNIGHGYKGNKKIVGGVIQRGGNARLSVLEGLDRKTLHEFINKHVSNDAEAIYTDEWPSYNGIGDSNTKHETVNHSQNEWVRGDVYTNSVENVWSLLKRSIMGSYHKVSAKHLDAYLDELEWRFNNRENPYLFRDTLLKLIHSSNLEYKNLVVSSSQ